MAKRAVNKGAWTADEDRKLSQYVEMHGPNKWKSVAIKSGYFHYFTCMCD